MNPTQTEKTEVRPITDVPAADLKGKRVMVRCDFNVQVFEGKIIDDLRIRKTLPTISYLRQAGAKVILISHIESKDESGLRPICTHINERYVKICGVVVFIENFLAPEAANVLEMMSDGDVVLFENLRIDPREKANDMSFAEELRKHADIYVNDAFAVSHREHASVVGLPSLFPQARYAGVQMMQELQNLKIAFNPPHPFVFILGGAKFETKLPLIQKFSKADKILLGGALLNDILKARGYAVGKSLVFNAESGSEIAASIAEISKNPKLVIPDDVIVEGPNGVSTKILTEIAADDVIMDVGPSMSLHLEKILKDTKFILWNGPMGNYEKGFKKETIAMARVIAGKTKVNFFERILGQKPANAVLGGGDTTAAVAELGFDDTDNPNLFVSTGGGAMLEYLLNETLPGVEALKN